MFQIMFAFILLSFCTVRFSVTVKCRALSFIVKREMLFDSDLSENLKCQSPIISSHFARIISALLWCAHHPLVLAELALSSPDGPWVSHKLLFWGWMGKMILGSAILTWLHQSVILLLLSKIDFSLFPLFCQKCICYICHLTWQTKMPHLNKTGVINSRMTEEGKLKTKQNKAEQFRSSGSPPHFSTFSSLHNKQSKPKSQIHWEVSLFAI